MPDGLPSLERVTAARASTLAIANALEVVESRGPMADVWETEILEVAIGLFLQGEYAHALRMTVHAMTPPNQRSREYPLPTDTRAVEELRALFLSALSRDKLIKPQNA